MRQNQLAVLLCIATCSILTALPCPAATAAGHWEGSVTLPTGELPIVVDLDRGPEGAWKGEIDIAMQGIHNLALESISVEANAVSFRMSGIPGEPTFAGTMSEDGSLAGNLTQSGQTFPFRLSSKGAPTMGAAPVEEGPKLVDKGVPGQGAEGEWHGVLIAGPSRLRLIVKIKKGSDGVLAGTVDSVDQKAMGMPIDRVTFQEGKLEFEMSGIGASYTGTLNEDGSKLSGSWSQKGGSAPLDLLRSGR